MASDDLLEFLEEHYEETSVNIDNVLRRACRCSAHIFEGKDGLVQYKHARGRVSPETTHLLRLGRDRTCLPAF